MQVRFGATTKINAASVAEPRTMKALKGVYSHARQEADSHAQQVLRAFEEKQDSEVGFLIKELTDDRVELSLQREVNPQEAKDPRWDAYVARVSAPGVEAAEVRFHAAKWVPSYGDSSEIRYNDTGVKRAVDEAFRAIVTAHKQLTKAKK